MKKFYLAITIILLLACSMSAQNIRPANADSLRLESVKQKLEQLSQRDSAMSVEVDISTGKMSLAELLRNVAKVSGANLSVKGGDNIVVISNFNHTKVSDLIYFLCKEYKLNVDVVGNIVSIFPAAPVPSLTPVPKVEYRIASQGLSYELSADKLTDVIKRINALSGVNIIIPQSMTTKQVSGFVNDMPLDDAIAVLASTNGIEAEKGKNGVWSFIEAPAGTSGTKSIVAPAFVRSTQFGKNQLSVDSLGMITASIGRGSVQDIIIDLCSKLKINYFFVTPVNSQTSLYLKDVDFDNILTVMMAGTQFTFYVDEGIYIFGQAGKDNLITSTKVISLNNRSVDKVVDLIPSNIKTGLQVQQYSNLNSIIVSGDHKQIVRVENFLKSVDKRVPLVTIEIMIVDATKSNIMESGITMGLGDKPTQTAGTLSPGVNMTLGASSVNSLINSFNGFGSVNLGKVTPNFYLGLQFLEQNGTIEVRSTPKLSTLNGNEATLKSGETQYYKEVLNNITGSLTPIQSESYTWKSVEANLEIKIIPYVSSDDHITLDIDITQSEFTPRIEKDAPPGVATRSFKSIIKVSNEDMVLLGGIDRNSFDKTNKGLPFVARVPVLRWLFGTTKDNKVDHKLNVFIKPTIIR